MGLEEIDSAGARAVVAKFIWPLVAHRPGLLGALARWAVVRLLCRLDIALAPSGRQRRLVTVAKTRERLDATAAQVTLYANWRERQRRAANLVDWALQGALGSVGHEDAPRKGEVVPLSEELAAYEARSFFPTWAPLLRPGLLRGFGFLYCY